MLRLIGLSLLIVLQMIDTHAHLYDERFADDIEQVLERGANQGVTHFVIPDVDCESRILLEKLVGQFSQCLPTVGLHPTSVNDNPAWKNELQAVRDALFSGKRPYVAVGEAGLDLYWSKDFLEEQTQALKAQAEWAIEKNLPLILHVRDAWAEIIPALEPFEGKLRGVFHSFSGTYQNYLQTQELGDFYVGVSGTVTYKNSPLPEVIAKIPLERIVLETDAPYLPPVPHRGKRNESAYLNEICLKIAEIKGTTYKEVETTTDQNARKLFNLA